MRKINTLKNPRIITFFLLFLTFGLAIIAVVTAINLQNKKNVNPTPSKADCQYPNACAEAADQCYGASQCEANPLCQNDPTCAANCASQRNDCTINTQRCAECNSTVPTVTNSPADSCNRQAVDTRYSQLTGQGWPSCWAGNNARANFGADPSVCNNPTYQKTNISECDNNPSNNPDVNYSTTAPTNPPVSTATPLPTATTPPDWADPNAKCRYEQGVNPPCNPAEFLSDGGIGVNQMAYCKNETGVTSPRAGGGTWVYGNPVPGPLSCGASCSGLSGYISGTDSKNTASCNNPYRCQPPTSTPTPPTNTATPTSTPAPQPASASVSAVCTDGTTIPTGSLTLKATVNDFATKSDSGSVNDIGIDFNNITFDASHPSRQITLDAGSSTDQGPYQFSGYTCTNGGVIQPGGNVSCVARYTGCRGTTTNSFAVCNNITVSPATGSTYADGGGVKITANTYGRDGATYNYRVKVTGTSNSTFSWTSNTHSETRDGTVSQAFGPSTGITRTNTSARATYNVVVEAATGGNTVIGNVNACTATFELPATNVQPQCVNMYIDSSLNTKQMSPGQEATMTMTVLNPSASSATSPGTATMFNESNRNTAGTPQIAKVSNLNFSGYSELGLTSNGAGSRFLSGSSVNGNIGTYTWKVKYEQLFQNDQNFNNTPLTNIQINGLAGGMTNFAGACVVHFVKVATPPVCTGLTVTPSTNIKQGDTLAVKVNASDTTNVRYRLDSNFGYNSGATGTYQTSPDFSVPIPTSSQLSGITLTGTVFRDGQSSSQNCNFSYTFTPGPVIEKDILPNGANGSTGLTGSAPNYVVDQNDIVKYNVKVKNNGQNVMQNLIVVDTLSAYDPTTGTPVNTPFGDITEATNLDRTTGTQSTPQSVGPRVPSGNGPYSVGVKSVEWTKINSLFPTEEYTGTLDVKILAFSGTPVLRNTVCLYQDTNNNGQYDQGTDKELSCDHELIYTAQPEFTVVKTALEETGSTPVGVLEPGKKFRYVITLTNTSSSDLNLDNVTITDNFDNEFLSKFDITNISDSGSRNGNVITWSDLTGTVAAGGTKTVSFIAQVKSDFFSGNENCSEVVKNNVMASSTSPIYTTPQYEISVTVLNRLCRTEFEIIKTVNPGTVAPGGTVTYTVQITNRGTKSAPIVRIVDDYADEFTYQNDTTTFVRPDGSTFNKNPTVQSGTLIWEFGSNEQVTLAPSQSLSFTYKMTASQNAGNYPNTVCLENPSGGCDDAIVTIQTQPNTGITATNITKIIGFGFMAASVMLWFIINKKKNMNYHSSLRTRRTRGSYNDRVESVTRRLRNR